MSRILLVDDDEVTRTMIGHVLHQGGHEVSYATDGEAALRFLRSKSFDVVVTDLAMPSKNGLRLIKEIREVGDDIPVIAVSGTNADQLCLAEDYGANAALTKPVDREALLAAVSKVLKQKDDFWEKVWL